MPHSERRDLAAAPTVLLEGPGDAIVIKPAGMSVELRLAAGAAGEDPSLLGWARRRWPQATPRLPHRLDRIARGIVVVALSDHAVAFHSAMIAQRRWNKYYLARIPTESIDPQTLLGPHRVYLRTRGRRAEVVRSGGDPAWLTVLAAAPAPAPSLSPTSGVASPAPSSHGRSHAEQSHLLIQLETGRFHQIRATLAHLGAPIAGDPIYDPRMERWRHRPAHSAPPAPYLEHIVLRLPEADGALGGARFERAGGVEAGDLVERTIFWPSDPERERLDPAMHSAIAALLTPQQR